MAGESISIEFTYEELSALITLEEEFIIHLPDWHAGDPLLPGADGEAQKTASDKIRDGFIKLYNK